MPETPPAATPPAPAARSAAAPSPRRRLVALWGGFVFVHAVLITINLSGLGWTLGDVEQVYLGWAQGTVSGAVGLGITTDFVYPILALVPILAALSFGAPAYAVTWLGLVTVLNGVAFGVLIGRRPALRVAVAAWWWLVFLLLLGPIALARIDSVTVPLAIIGLLWLGTRPFWGGVLLSVATWVKVWPVAALIALAVASKTLRGRVLAAFVATSALIIGVAVLAGSGFTILSFVTEQTDRGLQIEAPVASWWLWLSALGDPDTLIYYDHDILTYQVLGPGTEIASALMTPLLVLGVAVVLLVGWRAQRAGATAELLFPPLLLALVLTLITINKVGSPQFMTWLAAPLILGLVMNPRAWRAPALVALVMAALTHLVYPYLYYRLLNADPVLVLVLTVRNLLELIVLIWMLVRLWKLGTSASASASPSPSAPVPTGTITP